MKKILTILIVSLVFTSCHKNRTSEKIKSSLIFVDEDFKVVNKLKGIELSKITDSLHFSANLIVIKDYLFVNEVESDKFLHAIEIPNDKYLGKFGNKGEEPGEILIPWRLSKSEEGALRIFDLTQKKVVEFNIDSLLNKKGHNKEYRFPTGTRPYSAIIHDDKLFYLDLNNVKHRVFEKKVNDTIIVGHGILPPQRELLLSDYNIANMYQASMYNNKDLFAFSYNSIPRVEIFDSKQDKWFSIIGPENYIPLYSEFNSRTLYNPTINISDKYIYTLYNGKEYKGDIKAELTNILYVFNHNGGLVKKLVLDRSIFTFDVYKDKFIYALTAEEEVFKILKFEL